MIVCSLRYVTILIATKMVATDVAAMNGSINNNLNTYKI